jgi:hypothetical protein
MCVLFVHFLTVNNFCLYSNHPKQDDSFLAKLTRISYKRPKEMKGLEALSAISKWLDHGIRLKVILPFYIKEISPVDNH